MITLFVLGVLLFACRLVWLTIRAAWGITRGILCVVALPVILIGLLVAGLISLAAPILIVALLAVFLLPIGRKS